jgi:para-nitrobenzyl esterase
MKLSATGAESDRLMRTVLTEFGLTLADARKLQQIPADELIARANVAISRGNPPHSGPPGVGARPPGWSPSVDGRVLPEIPFGTGAPAISAKIPMIIGSTRDEWAMAYNRDQPNMTEAELAQGVRRSFGAKTDAIIAAFKRQYPGAPPAELMGVIMSAPLRNQVLDQVAAKHAQGAAPVYTYWFVWQTPVLAGMPKAFHCSDLPHCFANADRCDTTTGAGPDAHAVADRMSAAWLNFARTGNPSQPGLAWPAYQPSTVPTLVFDTRSRVENDPAGAARRTLI